MDPPSPLQPQLIQNQPNTKGRNLKKPGFKVSFVEPQIGQQQGQRQGQRQEQQQEQQQAEQQALNGQKDQHYKVVDIRWLTIN